MTPRRSTAHRAKAIATTRSVQTGAYARLAGLTGGGLLLLALLIAAGRLIGP